MTWATYEFGTYDTFADLEADNSSSVSFTQLNIDSNFTTVGFAYDGQYRLLVESNSDASAGSEIAQVTYDTFADLIANNSSSVSFTQLNINSNFTTVGFVAVPEPNGFLCLGFIGVVAGVLRKVMNK